MMTNLFSIFDPSSSTFSMNWMMMIVIPVILPVSAWKTSQSFQTLVKKGLSMILKELRFSLKNKKFSQEIILITMFTSILCMNFSALYPQNFSLTSHLITTFPLSLLIWATIIMFSWFNKTNHMLSHLLPQGTPVPLMSFMVLIELTSNIIRPLTLCIRLTANLIAGHLLMTLLGSALMNVSYTYAMILSMAPMLLSILEAAVACIQAYVFMTLATLYIMETN